MAVAAAVAPRPGAAAIAPDSGENPLLSAERDDCNETPDVVVCDGLSADALPPRPEKFLFLFQISPPSFLRRPLSKGNISILGNTNDQRVNMKPCFITTSTDKN